MNLYSIYANCSDKNSDFIIVKQGFSLTACVFNFFWAFYHRMWLLIFFTAITNFITTFCIKGELSPLIENIKYIAQIFVFGFFATEMREFYAQKKGMRLHDIILASSEEEAQLKYFIRSDGKY